MPAATLNELADQALAARANRLKEALNRAGGRAAVARRINMPLPTLDNYLGGRDMKASALIALAEACNVSIQWLATGYGAESADLDGKSASIFSPAELAKPAHYWALLVLTMSAKEFYEKSRQRATLRQVLEWIAANYANSLPLPDTRLKLVDAPEGETE